ncbi:YbaB/EbfC family nucleoid-associated protein [Actinokineospora sp. 24-640]
MSTPLHNKMADALADLRVQRDRIEQTLERMRAVEASATSDDRTVEATVDNQGRLTALRLNGRRWRDTSPKELCARLVDVVSRAQDKAAAETAALAAGMVPAGMDLAALRDSGPDLDALFAAVDDPAGWSR